MNPEICILPDSDELAAEAAQRIVQAAEEALDDHGYFTLALAGGRTPEATYERLAAYPLRDQIEWSRTILFFGDERFVPCDDPRSNYAMAERTLFEPLDFPRDQVMGVPTTLPSAAAAAVCYHLLCAEAFDVDSRDVPPPLDLILLGLGDDGHTASLFPGAAALAETKRWVVDSPPGVLPPPVERVTFTFPMINAARQVMFLVAGANKAEAVQDVLEGNATVEKRPAAGVRPEHGKLVWLLDTAAAKLLSAK